jgi:hypothetical protein
MEIQLFITAFFCINFFIAGYRFAKDVEWASSKSEKNKELLWVAFCLLFGSLFWIIVFTLSTIWVLLENIDNVFQIRFFVKFYLFGGYYNMEDDNLKRLNRIAYNRKNKKTISSFVLWKACGLVNKRNNYTYVHKEDGCYQN